MSNDEYVNIGAVVVKRLSQKAALIIADGNETWIPFSQTQEGSVAEMTEGAKLEQCFVKKWIAEDKDLPFT